MKEIQINDNKGTICIDPNCKMYKLQVTVVNDKGYPDSHYVFNQEVISNCSSITYQRQGGRTKFYSNGTEIHPNDYDYPVPSSGAIVPGTFAPIYPILKYEEEGNQNMYVGH